MVKQNHFIKHLVGVTPVTKELLWRGNCASKSVGSCFLTIFAMFFASTVEIYITFRTVMVWIDPFLAKKPQTHRLMLYHTSTAMIDLSLNPTRAQASSQERCERRRW